MTTKMPPQDEINEALYVLANDPKQDPLSSVLINAYLAQKAIIEELEDDRQDADYCWGPKLAAQAERIKELEKKLEASK